MASVSFCMDAEMGCFHHLYPIHVVKLYVVTVVVGLASSAHRHQPAEFRVSSLLDAVLPGIRPLVEASSNKCETLKSFLGISYEKMLKKNLTYIQEMLNLVLIRNNGNVKYNLTATKRLGRFMNNKNRVVVLIHGFLESSDGIMVSGVAPELMKKSNLTILALDGRKVITIEYFRSSTYARFIGENLGIFLSEIIKKGHDPLSITLIGHSLGAHIAGAAGMQVRKSTGQRIGRIVGLDPAGPCFNNVSDDDRLDRGDAAYVDVIHTNGGMLGLREPIGHKDYFPNGGTSQPGCFLYTCNHSRAWELFAESVNSPNNFPARKCADWTTFKEGRCSKREIDYMGYGSSRSTPGLYYLTTSSTSPFGLGRSGSE